MRETKVEKDKVKVPYFFIESYLDNMDCDYFKKKIDEGVKESSNKSFITNVKGRMTAWEYFKKDLKFLETIFPVLDYIDVNLNPPKYYLKDAWGVREGWGEYTSFHNHGNTAYFSGLIYLNDHDSKLEFPELDKNVIVKKDKVLIFSSFLMHGTKRNVIKEPKYAIAFNFDYVK